MHVLMICSAYPPDVKGGGEVSTGLLAEGLVKAGHKVSVLTIADTPSQENLRGVWLKRIRSPNIFWNFKVRPTALQNLIWHLYENKNNEAERSVLNQIGTLKPDLVVTSTTENFGANAWIAAWHANVPSVHILRSYNTMCTRGIMFKEGENCPNTCLKCDVLSLGKRVASHHVNGVIGLSRHVLKAHLDNGYFKHADPAVISNFIPNEVYERTKKIPIKDKNSPVTFGYFGILTPQKGLELLIEAFKKTADKTKARLVIGGSGDETYLESLKDSLQGYEVDFLGWVDQAEILPQIDYLVVPSLWHEPLGRVVLEAFSYATPVIGSNRGGIPDMIEQGYNGFLFDPAEPSSLEKIMQDVAANDAGYKEMAENVVASLEKYSESNMIKLYEAYFEKIAKNFKQ